MRLLRDALPFLGAVLLPALAHATPFCVDVRGQPLQCIYDDANECRKRAGQLGGTCAANPAEIYLTSGTARFCLVDSSRTAQCLYLDRGSCGRDAARIGGACLDSHPIDPVQSNPYQNDPLLRY